MEVQLSTIIFFFITTILVLLTSPTASQITFPPTASPAFSPISDETDYIRTSCETTRYPEICFSTLSNYSYTIHHDPCRLAMMAIHVALSKATHMANYVTNMSNQSLSINTTESLAIQDCSSVFEDAVYEIKKSRKEMKHLGWSGESIKFQLSNVQTWMSAALTNEDTCMDGFEDVADESEMKKDVCDHVVKVMQVTSNALALVNHYADKYSGN
uniref:pectinesterase inhibitor 7 n=1 Tax=Erigeron canadensis TaxID=72917 RepID=UPI001CB911DE|nr:pectinesterase inhibitor 7 [Erigeron canadensis]